MMREPDPISKWIVESLERNPNPTVEIIPRLTLEIGKLVSIVQNKHKHKKMIDNANKLITKSYLAHSKIRSQRENKENLN